jgi:hypothetical protein
MTGRWRYKFMPGAPIPRPDRFRKHDALFQTAGCMSATPSSARDVSAHAIVAHPPFQDGQQLFDMHAIIRG